MRERLDSFWAKDATKTVLASLASIVIGLLVGCVVIVIVGLTSDSLSPKSAWEGVRIVLASIFSTGRTDGALTFGFNPVSTGNMLFRATPLIMTGLSVAVAFKTGLFNIGAPGQYLMGTMASLMIALGIPSDVVPPAIIWILAFLGGAAAGALWGCIPGLVKAYLNINEVLASIMTNWIAANAVTWAFEISNFKNVVENTKTNYIYKTSFNGVETAKMGLDKLFPGSQVNGGIIVAIIIAILMYILINKTSSRPAAATATRRGMRASRTSATSCCRWPLPARSRARAPLSTTSPATRSSTGRPTSPCPPRASTASPSPCSRRTTP